MVNGLQIEEIMLLYSSRIFTHCLDLGYSQKISFHPPNSML